MLSTIRNAWKVPELRKKLLWTVFLILIFRAGAHIPASGFDTEYLKQITSSGLLGFYDLLSGGAFSKFSILALGVTPYINASIIMQLLTIAIPSLEQMQKEGQEGRNKIQNATRYMSIVLAVILAVGVVATLKNSGVNIDLSKFEYCVVILSLVVGSTFCIWLGDQITVKGFGNGTSILIFVNIVSRMPSQIANLYKLEQAGTLSIVQIAIFLCGVVALLVSAIYFSLAERKIPVQYAGKSYGKNMVKGQSTHIPLSIVSAAVIAIIFAMSVMGFPQAVAQFFPKVGWLQSLVTGKYSPFNQSTWMYPVLYAILTLFFTWFYNEITLKPDEMAENLNKSAGFVLGVRPGDDTVNYFEKIILKISIVGGLYAALLAVIPVIIEILSPSLRGVSFGATSVLILIGVALDFTRRIESQMVMRHYEGFLK